jgi:antirestriction protein ArdC
MRPYCHIYGPLLKGAFPACEELVAELGAELSIKGELEHHASYLENWLGVLKQDKTASYTYTFWN